MSYHLRFLSLALLCSLARSLELNYCGKLPSITQRIQTVTVQDQDYIYVLGGIDWPPNISLDEVVRFDPRTYIATTVGQFPTPVHSGAGAKDKEGNFYYFGGGGWIGESKDAIYMFNDTNLQPVALEEVLPRPLTDFAAVAIGEFIYLIGGESVNDVKSSDVLRFNPVTNDVIVVGQLPQPVSHMSAVGDGIYVYIFGGFKGVGAQTATDEILRFNSETSMVEIVEVKLPVSMYGNEAVVIGEKAYIMGGQIEGSSEFDKMITFDLKTHAIMQVEGVNEFPLQVSVAYAQDTLFVFGGRGSEEIVCYTEGSTQDSAATAGTFPLVSLLSGLVLLQIIVSNFTL